MAACAHARSDQTCTTERLFLDFFDIENKPRFDGMAVFRFADADKARRWNTSPDHAPNVSGALESTPGSLRYVVSHATRGGSKPEYAGLAEVYYSDRAAVTAHMRQLG